MTTQNEFIAQERASKDTIDFKKGYVDMAGDILAGLMLSQVIYWHLPGGNGRSRLRVQRDGYLWLAKKYDDWYDECRLTADQARRALRILKGQGLVETQTYKFAGAPTTHIRINWPVFLTAYDAVLRQNNSDLGSSPDGNGPQPRSYTENTTKTTNDDATAIFEKIAANELDSLEKISSDPSSSAQSQMEASLAHRWLIEWGYTGGLADIRAAGLDVAIAAYEATQKAWFAGKIENPGALLRSTLRDYLSGARTTWAIEDALEARQTLQEPS